LRVFEVPRSLLSDEIGASSKRLSRRTVVRGLPHAGVSKWMRQHAVGIDLKLKPV
jgi:hypothetical protein